ncbi:acyltransferase family protein [Nostoc sphaeroides]|uniref:Acyltransferase n=1 Tax=Nostoc sphaeroides CCNUC1 TaxID=2653204 RepID=A0A5P8WCR2_9NOSO|nr:acyltransferase [Nostoc sphaeroides]QFS50342.1 acyltransferase [Nostoc sphaeroides CCNUC1]
MKRIAALDYLRFIAAISVVCFHYFVWGIVGGKISSIDYIQDIVRYAKYGYLGVDLFFLISGYVIFFSAVNRSPEQFAVSRAVRLYPAYVTSVLFTSFFAFFWGGDKMHVYLNQILANLIMYQPLHRHPFVDGVYWTLMYEINFYLMVFVLLFIGLSRHLNTLFKLWPFLFLIAKLNGWDGLPLLGGYYCYFAAGALFALSSAKRDYIAFIGIGICFWLSIDFNLHLLYTDMNTSTIFFSKYWVAFLITLFYLGFFLISFPKIASLQLPASRILGGLTYPIYLIHAHFGYMFISHFADQNNRLNIYLLTISIVLLISLFIHRAIEIRFGSFWKSFFEIIFGRPIFFVRNILFQ